MSSASNSSKIGSIEVVTDILAGIGPYFVVVAAVSNESKNPEWKSAINSASGEVGNHLRSVVNYRDTVAWWSSVQQRADDDACQEWRARIEQRLGGLMSASHAGTRAPWDKISLSVTKQEPRGTLPLYDSSGVDLSELIARGVFGVTDEPGNILLQLFTHLTEDDNPKPWPWDEEPDGPPLRPALLTEHPGSQSSEGASASNTTSNP